MLHLIVCCWVCVCVCLNKMLLWLCFCNRTISTIRGYFNHTSIHFYQFDLDCCIAVPSLLHIYIYLLFIHFMCTSNLKFPWTTSPAWFQTHCSLRGLSMLFSSPLWMLLSYASWACHPGPCAFLPSSVLVLLSLLRLCTFQEPADSQTHASCPEKYHKYPVPWGGSLWVLSYFQMD